jgi:acetyltransferase EpsM
MNAETDRRPDGVGIVVFGASDHARVLFSVAQACGVSVAAFAESSPTKREFMGRPVVDVETALRDFCTCAAVVGIGNPKHRSTIAEMAVSAGMQLTTLVHPSAVVAPDVLIGEGTVVLESAVICTGTTVGRNAIMNCGSIVGHTCQIGDLVQLCPGANVAGNVLIGTGTWIGIGATVIQNVAIGKWTMIGAGAVVVRDVPDEKIAFGVPAKIQRHARYFQ